MLTLPRKRLGAPGLCPASPIKRPGRHAAARGVRTGHDPHHFRAFKTTGPPPPRPHQDLVGDAKALTLASRARD